MRPPFELELDRTFVIYSRIYRRSIMIKQFYQHIVKPSNESRTFPLRALLAVAGLTLTSTVLVVASSSTRTTNSESLAIWREHRDRCDAASGKSYKYDRFRAIKGRVADFEGTPVAAAEVRCSRVEDLVRLGRVGVMSDEMWAGPVFAATRTDSEGRYDFPHLPVGAYTFFYATPGLAPAIKDMIVVQDGLGAVIDVTLERSRKLRVQASTESRLRLVPYRWWPELPEADVDLTTGLAEFVGLGGPFRRGLIVAVGKGNAWRVVGRFDLDTSELAVTGLSRPASMLDLSEAAGFGTWGDPASSEYRAFHAALSPIALLWADANGDAAFRIAMADFLSSKRGVGVGSARGFGPQPFLPVLIESRMGFIRIGWTSEASEFEFLDLPAGPYRVRALDLFGKPTFSRGVYVAAGTPAKLSNGSWTKPDIDGADTREIMGFVRWEGGMPAAKAQVFVQHSGDFRLYLKRVEADENGYFRVPEVPVDQPYFAFAVPAGEKASVREFVYFDVPSSRREVWRDLTLNGHRVIGQIAGINPEIPLQLVRTNQGIDRLSLEFSADALGRFSIANVPHGRYSVQSKPGEGFAKLRSLPFEVVEGRLEVTVRWP